VSAWLCPLGPGLATALLAHICLAQTSFNPETWILAPGKEKRLVHARPGGEVSFGGLFLRDKNCESTDMNVRIVQQPAHGRAYTCAEERVENRHGPGADCFGHRLQGVGVWYLPASDTPPDDTFEYEYTAAGHTTHVTGIVKFEKDAPRSPPSKCNKPVS
jgi:hypothetical protein